MRLEAKNAIIPHASNYRFTILYLIKVLTVNYLPPHDRGWGYREAGR